MISKSEMMENTLRGLLRLADNGTLNDQTLAIIVGAARNCFKDDAPMLTRHDIPRPLWDVLDTMIEVDLVDAASVYEMGAAFGSDFKGLTEAIIEIADANRHNAPEKRRAVLAAVDAYHAATAKA